MTGVQWKACDWYEKDGKSIDFGYCMCDDDSTGSGNSGEDEENIADSERQKTKDSNHF